MATELEIKFLDFNIKALKQQLNLSGASLIFSNLFRITIFHGLSGDDREYIRVRDEGNFVTLVHKRTYEKSIAATEHEVIVDSYERAIALLKAMGLRKKRTEEKQRIHYKLGEASIDIDSWPGIPTYIEIEADTEDVLRLTCEKLGFDFEQGFFGDAHDVFRHYGVEPSSIPNMVFSQEQRLSLEESDA